MRTLDSGIGTFPLHESTGSTKFNTKPQSSALALKGPCKSRTLERELPSVDELNSSVLHTAYPVVSKGTGMHLLGTSKKGNVSYFLWSNVEAVVLNFLYWKIWLCLRGVDWCAGVCYQTASNQSSAFYNRYSVTKRLNRV